LLQGIRDWPATRHIWDPLLGGEEHAQRPKFRPSLADKQWVVHTAKRDSRFALNRGGVRHETDASREGWLSVISAWGECSGDERLRARAIRIAASPWALFFEELGGAGSPGLRLGLSSDARYAGWTVGFDRGFAAYLIFRKTAGGLWRE
jgi:hypothetical protein